MMESLAPSPRSPKDIGKDEDKDGATQCGKAEHKVEDKDQGLLKHFGNFRTSKKSIKKPSEAEEQSSQQKELPGGLSLNFRASKKALRRQTHLEEPNSPDKKEPFGSLVVRLSKKYYQKNEHIEDKGSPDKKETPGMSNFLVSKLRNSKKGKKKLDFNEQENKSQPEEAIGMKEVEEKVEDKLLSVMEINELIHTRQLQRAFRSIASKEEQLIEEIHSKDFNENITDFTIRARDVDLLYSSLSNTMRSIIKETLHQEQVDEHMVTSLVQLIESEAIIHPNANVNVKGLDVVLGQPRRWKHLWREAVKDSVTSRIQSVPIDLKEQGWLCNHLDNLRLNTVGDLLKVKNTLMCLYPEDYDVCSTYLRSFHDAVSTHIQENVVTHTLTFSQLFCLLDWIINRYKSAEFLENPELLPEMSPACLPPLLPGDCFEKLKRDYNSALQETIGTYMKNLLEMEKKKWETGEEMSEESLMETYQLPLYADIENIIGTHVRESAKLSEELEKSAFLICVEQLGLFSTRLQDMFSQWSVSYTLMSVRYSIYYINSLLKLRHNTAQADSERCRMADDALNTATEHLKQLIFHLFTRDTKPNFQKLITKKWLKNSIPFGAIMKSLEILCQCLKYLIGPHDKEMARRVHKYLVKEYITQIMRGKMSLSLRKRKKAAQRMKEEGDLLNVAAEEMGSDHDGLCQVIHCISEIIGAKKKEEIKPKLDVLYQLYSDVSKEHILCILHLRGTGPSKKLLEHFHNLRKSHQTPSELEEKLFSEIDCTTQIACFPVSL